MKVKITTFLCPSNTAAKPLDASDVMTHNGKALVGKNKFAPGQYGMNWGGVRKASGEAEMKAYGEGWRGVLLTVVDPDSKVPTRNIELKDITDGTSNTVAMAEKLDSFGWGVGGWGGSEFDVNTDPISPGEGVVRRRAFTGSMHPGGMNILIADGSVKFITAKIETKTWYALTTRADAEIIAPGDVK